MNKSTNWSPYGEGYMPSGKAVQTIPAGSYEITSGMMIPPHLVPIELKQEKLITVDDTLTNELIEEIQEFWDKKPLYRKFDLPYKRGILMYGIPGAGKTCAIRLIAKEVINRGGIVIYSKNPNLLEWAIKSINEIQPETAIVVVMEELETVMYDGEEDDLLQVIDGAVPVDNVVFLATTNYIDEIPNRMKNRPSRFDRVEEVGLPSAEFRRIYLESLIEGQELTFDVAKYVDGTEGFTVAHLKELFITTVILSGNFEETIARISSMPSDDVQEYCE